MGIQSLLINTKSIQTKKNISSYSGQKVGIDAYAWIHKGFSQKLGIFTCAQQLAQQVNTRKHINFVMERIRQLQENNVIPIMVMDGKPLPSKKKTEEERLQNRQEYRKRAEQYEQEGNQFAAYRYYGLSVDVDQEMANLFMDEFKKNNIETIIAPYEADSQLAYLNSIGYIDFIITEDSDLLCFGAKKVLYKYNEEKTQEGYEIQHIQLKNLKELDVAKFSFNQFLHMCILSGCDYVTQINRIGTLFIQEQKKLVN